MDLAKENQGNAMAPPPPLSDKRSNDIPIVETVYSEDSSLYSSCNEGMFAGEETAEEYQQKQQQQQEQLRIPTPNLSTQQQQQQQQQLEHQSPPLLLTSSSRSRPDSRGPPLTRTGRSRSRSSSRSRSLRSRSSHSSRSRSRSRSASRERNGDTTLSANPQGYLTHLSSFPPAAITTGNVLMEMPLALRTPSMAASSALDCYLTEIDEDNASMDLDITSFDVATIDNSTYMDHSMLDATITSLTFATPSIPLGLSNSHRACVVVDNLESQTALPPAVLAADRSVLEDSTLGDDVFFMGTAQDKARLAATTANKKKGNTTAETADNDVEQQQPSTKVPPPVAGPVRESPSRLWKWDDDKKKKTKKKKENMVPDVLETGKLPRVPFLMRHKCLLLVLVCTLCLLVAALAGLVVLLREVQKQRNNNNDNNSATDLSTNTNIPWSSPTSNSSTGGATTPSSLQPILTRAALLQAVDLYLMDDSPNSLVAERYGHPLGSWTLGPDVTDLSHLCSVQRNPSCVAFDEDLSGWNVQNVQNMDFMLMGATDFSHNLCAWRQQYGQENGRPTRVEAFADTACPAADKDDDAHWCMACPAEEDFDDLEPWSLTEWTSVLAAHNLTVWPQLFEAAAGPLNEGTDEPLFPLIDMMLDATQPFTLFCPTDDSLSTWSSSSLFSMTAPSKDMENARLLKRMISDPAWHWHAAHFVKHHAAPPGVATSAQLMSLLAASPATASSTNSNNDVKDSSGAALAQTPSLTMASGEQVFVSRHQPPPSRSPPSFGTDTTGFEIWLNHPQARLTQFDMAVESQQQQEEEERQFAMHRVEGFVRPKFWSQSIYTVLEEYDAMEVAASQESLSTKTPSFWMDALQNGRLAVTLANPQAQLTVFWPTRQAWEALGPALVSYLQSAEGRKDLDALLRFHVVPWVVPMSYADVPRDMRVSTLSGQDLHVVLQKETLQDPQDSSSITVQGASLEQTQLLANNGLVHLIDRVLLPDNLLVEWSAQPSSPADCEYKCPLNSSPREGLACATSFEECECFMENYKNIDGRCVHCNFTCPPNSQPAPSLTCHSGFAHCLCDQGYFRRNGQCLEMEQCNNFDCPANSAPLPDQECVDSFQDCNCHFLFTKRSGECVIDVR